MITMSSWLKKEFIPVNSNDLKAFRDSCENIEKRRALHGDGGSMTQTCLQHSLNIPLDNPRVQRIQELGAKRMENSKEEEELLQLILALKKEPPPEK